MRIIVDEMPKEPYKCPYCKDNSDMDKDEYICAWQNSGIHCWETIECPYFRSFTNIFEEHIDEYDCIKHDPYRYG
jgi:hypothetical protein